MSTQIQSQNIAKKSAMLLDKLQTITTNIGSTRQALQKTMETFERQLSSLHEQYELLRKEAQEIALEKGWLKEPEKKETEE